MTSVSVVQVSCHAKDDVVQGFPPKSVYSTLVDREKIVIGFFCEPFQLKFGDISLKSPKH